MDIGHTEFWNKTVAPIIAARFNLKLSSLRNIPYCLKRARIFPKKGIIYYGEQQSPELLKAIEQATGLNNLRFVHDDHEKRLPYDAKMLERSLSKINNDVGAASV